MASQNLIALRAMASQPSDVSKQICLYAMMKQYRLVWDFMITVIGSKYRNLDTSFSKIDLNTYTARPSPIWRAALPAPEPVSV